MAKKFSPATPKKVTKLIFAPNSDPVFLS